LDKQLLHNTLSVQSYSRQTDAMQRYIMRFARGVKNTIVVNDGGNIYVTKGNAAVYPCVIAHTDTVHKIIPHFVVNVRDGVYAGKNRENGEQYGVGGDDKVGIALALHALREFDHVKVAFFRDEEIGCLGTQQADLSFFDDCAFVIQADRKGNSEIVRNVFGVPLYDTLFAAAIASLLPRYGLHETQGMLTDVFMLRRMGLPLSVFNICAGYYDPHTMRETVVYDDVDKTWRFIREVIETMGHRQWVCLSPVESMYSFAEEEEEDEDDGFEFDDDDDGVVGIYEAQRQFDQCPHCGETNVEYDESIGMNFCWSCNDYFWVDVEVSVRV
jgi:tripeptide aminopeptidase